MQELLDKAQEISGIEYDISSYADIVEAIHVVQSEMGITGTTAKEAGDTITGSFGSVKAAWENLVTGIANPEADLGQLIDDFVNSISSAATNLLPIVETALNGVADLIDKVMPIAAERIPKIILDIAPKLITSGAEIVAALGKGILENAPMLLQTGIQVFIDLIKGFTEGLPTAIPMIVDAIMQIAEVIIDNLDLIIDAGIDLMIALIDGLIAAEPQFIEKGPEILEKLASALIRGAVKLTKAMIDIAGKMLSNFVKNIPEYAKAAGKIVDVIAKTLIGAVAGLVQIGVHLVQGIWEGIVSSTDWLKKKITGWVDNVVNFLKKLFKIASPSKLMRDEIGKNLALGLWEGWDKNNPIDMINDDITNFSNGMTVTSKYNGLNNNMMNNNLFNYSQLADAIVDGMVRANLGIRISDRDMGRIVREAVRYG